MKLKVYKLTFLFAVLSFSAGDLVFAGGKSLDSLPWLSFEIKQATNRIQGCSFEWVSDKEQVIDISRPDSDEINVGKMDSDDGGKDVIVPNKILTHQSAVVDVLNGKVFRAKYTQKTPGSGPGVFRVFGEEAGRILLVQDDMKLVTLSQDHGSALFDVFEAVPIIQLVTMLENLGDDATLEESQLGDQNIVSVKSRGIEVKACFNSETRSLLSLETLQEGELIKVWKVVKNSDTGPSWLPEEVTVTGYQNGKQQSLSKYKLAKFSKITDLKPEDFEYTFVKGYMLRDRTVPENPTIPTDDFVK